MLVPNARIVDILTRVAELLEMKGENPFRVRAYQTAARTVEALPRPVADMLGKGEDRTALSGIGADLAAKIETIVTTDSLPMLVELEKEVPAGLSDLLRVSGLGAKRAMLLHKALGIADLPSLEKAAKEGKVARVRGFGPRSEEKTLKGVREVAGREKRSLRLEVEARQAKDAGARFSLSSDAHSVRAPGNLRYSVDVARRAWLEPKDVINTYPVDRSLATIRRT